MIAAALVLQALGLVLLVSLATVLFASGRRVARGLGERIGALERRIAELEAASLAAAAEESRPEAAPLPVAAASARPSGAIAASSLPAELVAVLTAAAYAAIGKPVVLHYALVLGEDQGGAWRVAGRHDIFASHRIR